MFKRDGNNVESVLELSEDQAEEGGPFEVETLHGKDMVYLAGHVISGDTKVLEGKGVAAKGGKVPAGDHVVRVVIKVGTRTKRPAADETKVPLAEGSEVKKAKPASAPSASTTAGVSDQEAIAKLLAEKKAALMARINAKQGSVQ
jgi:DnaJ-class molecular chaperone